MTLPHSPPIGSMSFHQSRVDWPLLPTVSSPSWVMILPQVHLRKPCYDFYFL